jgi:hypothetical protein
MACPSTNAMMFPKNDVICAGGIDVSLQRRPLDVDDHLLNSETDGE